MDSQIILYLFKPNIFGILMPPQPPPSRYKLSTLARPPSQGGMTFPDSHKYFLGTQLPSLRAWWLSPDRTNPSTILEAAIVGSLETIQVLLFRGPKAPSSNSIYAYNS